MSNDCNKVAELPTPSALASATGYVAHLLTEIEKAKKQRLDAWRCGNTPIAMAQSKRISRLEAALKIENRQNQKPHNDKLSGGDKHS